VILVHAADKGQTAAVVKLLLDNGANFRDSLFLMKIKGWDEASIKKLKAYREEITGEPAMAEVDPAFLQEMKQMIIDLTKKVDDLTSASPAAAACQPKAARAKSSPAL